MRQIFKHWYISFATLFFALILFVYALPVFAQPAATTGAGARITGTLSQGVAVTATEGAATVLAIHAILYAAGEFLNYMLILSGALLDVAFNWNIEAIPTQIPIVVRIWGVMRDLVNSVFILILLWIAITIIFNFERLGGKKYLVRIIIIALLVNFSLAFVTATFGFANYLAIPFREAIGDREISEIIMKNSRIHEATNKISQEGVQIIQQLKTEAKQAAQNSSQPAASAVSPSVLTALGYTHEVHAQGVVSIAGRIWGAFKTGGRWTTRTAASVFKRVPEVALNLGVIAISGVIIATNYQAIINLAIADFFLFLTAAAFFIAAITLIGRLIAIVFLSILSPLAFLLFAVPGGFAKKHWDSWIESLLKWAFYLPAFYLFMYVSLLVLKAGSDGIADLNGFSENILVIMNLIIFLIFLWASIALARKMGITVADTVLGYAKTLSLPALGFATAGLAMGAGAIMRRPAMKKRIDTGMDKVSRVPILGTAMRPVMRATAEHYEKDRQDVLERSKKYASMAENNPQALANLLRTAPEKFGAKDAAAVAHAAKNEKVMKLLNDEEKQRALQFSSKFGLQREILETNPHLIKNDEDARRYVPGATDRASAINEIMRRTADKSEISKDAFKDDGTAASKESVKLITTAVWGNIKSANEMQKITREAPELADAMLKLLNEATLDEVMTIKKELGRAKAEAIDRYMHGSPMAQALWSSQIKSSSGWNSSPLW